MLRRLDRATASAAHPQPEEGSRKLRLAPPVVHDVLAEPGKPLEAHTRERFEPAFEHNFSRVRVHDDSRAARSADAVDALAYTVGEHIVLGGSIPNLDRTVAHELAHVVQQEGAHGLSGPLPIEDENSPVESAARDAAHAVLSGQSIQVGGQQAAGNVAAVRRQAKPEDVPAPAGDPAEKKDDPTAWLTLQAQGLAQYQRVYTIPRPPPRMLGAQLAANFQFHAGKTGFELAILGQYGHIFRQRVSATGVKPDDPRLGTGTGFGNQWQVALQPSYVFINTDRGTQIALIAQAGYAFTSSRDPGVAGKQFSLLGGVQVTQDVFNLGPVKVQGVAGLAAGGAWSKGPQDEKYSGAGVWQVNVGFQFALDTVKRRPPPPPPKNIEVTLPDSEQEKKPEDTKKDRDDEKKRADEAKKEEEAKKKVVEDPNKPADKGRQPPPPPPWDGKIFFLKDKPLTGLPDDKNVLDAGTGGEDLKDLKARVQAAFSADPTLRIAILGSASIEAPTPKYNCDLGSRRAEWLHRQLGLSTAQVADPADKSVIAGNCEDVGGLVSFGSTKAANTNVEEERRLDRYAIVHFHHL